MAQAPRPRVQFPLVFKLIGIITVIVVVAMGAVSVLSWWLYSSDAQARAEENNFAVSELLASQVGAEVTGLHARVLTLLDLAGTTQTPQTDSQVAQFFNRNPNLALVSIPGERDFVNTKFLAAKEIPLANLQIFLAGQTKAIQQAKAGETLVINASPSFGVPMAAFLAPYRDSGTPNVLAILFSTDPFQAMVQTKSANQSFVVDASGRVVAHSDSTLVKIAASLQAHPMVKKVLTSTTDNLQFRYQTEDSGEVREFIGTFHRIALGQLGVISSIPADDVYAAAIRITRQNAYLTGMVLVLSLLAVWFFARGVTRPVLRLVEAAHLIEAGEFEPPLPVTTRDELGLLTTSFARMGLGLAERERVKETFGKFVNKEIAEMALKGQLQLGGTRRIATIFFSDIRSFTAISETMEPEAVVEFLNAYMTRMVECIEQTGGVVDKFIGDAIMGVWGAPLSKGSAEEDALAAVRAMLLMRQSLKEFNADRGGPGKPLIKIGCGLNTGPCLAGQIGSHQRMEYTVIGDVVNLASRIEALNKPFATDVLISQDTYLLVGAQFLTEPMAPIKVKGKANPVQIYAVVNEKGSPGPQTLAQLRLELGMSPPSQTIDPDREEKKYELLPG